MQTEQKIVPRRGTNHYAELTLWTVYIITGIKNIVPELSQGSHEPFSGLMRQASDWIANETHIHVTNLKSVHVCRENQGDYGRHLVYILAVSRGSVVFHRCAYEYMCT